jgi:hypothetical protein
MWLLQEQLSDFNLLLILAIFLLWAPCIAIIGQLAINCVKKEKQA